MTDRQALYEAARQRREDAREALPRAVAEAERILAAAADEYDAAETQLRTFEQAPGIPLAAYRIAS